MSKLNALDKALLELKRIQPNQTEYSDWWRMFHILTDSPEMQKAKEIGWFSLHNLFEKHWNVFSDATKEDFRYFVEEKYNMKLFHELYHFVIDGEITEVIAKDDMYESEYYDKEEKKWYYEGFEVENPDFVVTYERTKLYDDIVATKKARELGVKEEELLRDREGIPLDGKTVAVLDLPEKWMKGNIKKRFYIQHVQDTEYVKRSGRKIVVYSQDVYSDNKEGSINMELDQLPELIGFLLEKVENISIF